MSTRSSAAQQLSLGGGGSAHTAKALRKREKDAAAAHAHAARHPLMQLAEREFAARVERENVAAAKRALQAMAKDGSAAAKKSLAAMNKKTRKRKAAKKTTAKKKKASSSKKKGKRTLTKKQLAKMAAGRKRAARERRAKQKAAASKVATHHGRIMRGKAPAGPKKKKKAKKAVRSAAQKAATKKAAAASAAARKGNKQWTCRAPKRRGCAGGASVTGGRKKNPAKAGDIGQVAVLANPGGAMHHNKKKKSGKGRRKNPGLPKIVKDTLKEAGSVVVGVGGASAVEAGITRFVPATVPHLAIVAGKAVLSLAAIFGLSEIAPTVGVSFAGGLMAPEAITLVHKFVGGAGVPDSAAFQAAGARQLKSIAGVTDDDPRLGSVFANRALGGYAVSDAGTMAGVYGGYGS